MPRRPLVLDFADNETDGVFAANSRTAHYWYASVRCPLAAGRPAQHRRYFFLCHPRYNPLEMCLRECGRSDEHVKDSDHKALSSDVSPPRQMEPTKSAHGELPFCAHSSATMLTKVPGSA